MSRNGSGKSGQGSDEAITLAEVDPSLRHTLVDPDGLVTPIARRLVILPSHLSVTDPDQKLCVVRINGQVPPMTFMMRAEDVGRYYQNSSPQVLPRSEALAHIRTAIGTRS